MVKPFTPAEAKASQANYIPDEIITVVNSFLAQRASSKSINITQEEVIEALKELEFNISQLFSKNMLDFEAAYRKAGWKVEYDKPAYNETHAAYWTFTAK